MNWEKVKNFLIFLFLGINIFLVFFMLNSVKTTSSTSKAVIEDTVSILAANNVTVDSHMVPYSIDNPGTFDAVPININHAYDSPKTLSPSNTESEIKKALAVIGVKNFYMSQTDEKNYYIAQKIGGYTLFDSGINAKTEGNRITLTGTWYKQKTKPKVDGFSGDSLVSVTGVLIDFINNPDRNPASDNSIVSIGFGYGIPHYDSGVPHVSVPAVPCYSIITSSGRMFIYEAARGEYLKNK